MKGQDCEILFVQLQDPMAFSTEGFWGFSVIDLEKRYSAPPNSFSCGAKQRTSPPQPHKRIPHLRLARLELRTAFTIIGLSGGFAPIACVAK